ncbi:hypothetical protein ACFE04_000311 [Oxalis oulophora]
MDSYDRENIILKKEYKHPDHPRCYCECESGSISVLMTAYDRANIGRRYYACGNIFDGLNCGFHQWYDCCEIVSPYVVDLLSTLNGAYCRAECQIMISLDDNMKLEHRIKQMEESTRNLSENLDKLNESHRRLEFENLELSNEIAAQRQIVKQVTEEKQKIIEDAAKVEFKVIIERIAH